MSTDGSSEDASEISDSEVDDYEAKSYKHLKAGKLKVQISEHIYRCPFCPGTKKQNYPFKDLLQHAKGVGKSNRKAIALANHRALAQFMENDLVDTGSISLEEMVSKDPPERKREDLFVWPWMGILVNIPIEVENGRLVEVSGTRLKERLARFNPLKVIPLWTDEGNTGCAIVNFNKDWTGFKDAMTFENHFEAEHHGKRDSVGGRRHYGSGMYGWAARADDYDLKNHIGNHVRKYGNLKTVADLKNEESRKTNNLLSHLASQIEDKHMHIRELECKCNETTLYLDKMMHGIQKMQQLASDHSHRIFEDNEKLRSELNCKRKELDERNKQLDKLVAQNDVDRTLDDEKQKNAMDNSSPELAVMEEKKVDEDVLRLIKEQKVEKEALLRKILQLEKKLDTNEKLELEIQQLKGTLQVMKHIGGEEDSAKNKMEGVNEELKVEVEEMEDLEALNQSLVVKCSLGGAEGDNGGQVHSEAVQNP